MDIKTRTSGCCSWTIGCFFCVCSIIVGSITPVHTANIAFMSGYGEGSHFMVQAIVGDELARRGHNVTGLISQAYEYKLKTPMYASFSSKLNFKSYDHATSVHDIRNVYHQLTDWVIEGKFLKNVIMEFLFTLKIPTNVLIEDCNFLLGNETFMNMFRSLELDLVIADSYYPCTVLLAEAVEAQYVSFCPTNLNPHFAHVQGTTLLPSIYPSGEFQFSQRMNFYQRFCNSLSYLKEKFFIRFLLWLYNPLRKKYQLNPQLTTREALSRSSLWLYDSDFYIDFPAPMLPNTVMVGGITTRPSKPLPPDILEFADSAGEDGFIIFSLGTYVINLKQDMNVLLAEAFSRLPQKVFWQLNTAVPANLPENVMAMKWLPQNDLLGHPNAKLLLYQSGVNGLYEALYHGVPIIAIPFAWDQPDVASRIVGRKIGLALDFWSMTPEKIVSSITTVINDTSYKENIMKLSAAWRDQKQHPKERAADSIEQVIKHGGEIMRFYGSELNFAQYYLLDVTAFCIFLCYLFLRLLLCLVRCHTWVYYRFSIPKSKLKGC